MAHLLGMGAPPSPVMHRVRRSLTSDTKVILGKARVNHACLRPYRIARYSRKSATYPARKGWITEALPNGCGRSWHVAAAAVLEYLQAICIGPDEAALRPAS